MKILFILAVILISFNSLAQELKVNVLELTGANANDEKRIGRALELIEEIVNTEEFRVQILGQRFTQTNMNSRQVLNSILFGRENFPGGTDHVIDLFMEMYYEESSTVGYTGPSDKFVHMNRFHHDEYTAAQTAGNLFHEWLHKLGHGHSRWNNSKRPRSVPYKLGNLLSERAAEIEANGDPLRKEMIMDQIQTECLHH